MSESVKLMRCPIDTNCLDCNSHLGFGVWVYYNAESGDAVCPECAVKRGWTPKQRVNKLIRKLELQEDIKALAKQRKIEASALLLLREEIDLHRLGERDMELQSQIVKLMQTVEDYLQQCGTQKEREALTRVFELIHETEDLQEKVKEVIQNRLLLLERKKKLMKPKMLV